MTTTDPTRPARPHDSHGRYRVQRPHPAGRTAPGPVATATAAPPATTRLP